MSDTTQSTSHSKTLKDSTTVAGLEDMIATDSSICFIDGLRTRLIYRGYSISDLANQSTFEEIVYLLFYKRLPNQAELKEFTRKFASMRGLDPKFIERMQGIPKTVHPMAALRTLISALSFFDADPDNIALPEAEKKALRMMAQIPTIISAWSNIRTGKPVIAPRENLSHAANFLYMLTGKEPDDLSAKALDLYLVLLADHELNASTFAARVTASTLSDYYSAMTSAIGALKGPLHGGANEQVIKMLLEIKSPANVDEYLKKSFAEKKKIMGFGHRVYKVQDPRSPLLKDMAEKVCQKAGQSDMFKMLVHIEKVVTEAKKLPSNVDFYSAAVLYCIGVPVDIFTPMFVMSRISGYSAHYLEQISDNRLLRPRANYTGDMDLAYTPIEKRG